MDIGNNRCWYTVSAISVSSQAKPLKTKTNQLKCDLVTFAPLSCHHRWADDFVFFDLDASASFSRIHYAAKKEIGAYSSIPMYYAECTRAAPQPDGSQTTIDVI